MMMFKSVSFVRSVACVMAVITALAGFFAGEAQAQARNLPLIRDAEIEGLLRLYTRPIFKAAGINPKSVKVYIINDQRINAFVAGGQRIFVNTGLLMQSDTPNEVIGVLAHETGHIAGGHLARMGVEIESASYTQIIGMLVGLAAIAGGIAAGSAEAAQAGQGVMMGSQGLAQRNFLAYARGMEASADQAALRYLTATGQSGRGMITLFEKLGRQSMAALQNADPYVMSHPMPMDRIRNLEEAAKKSKFYDTKDPPALVLRHELVQAKLLGFTSGPQAVMQRYPSSDQSMPARYARAIAMFRKGDIRNSLPIMESLTAELPENPYFWELKGQALLENGRAAEAVAPLEKALKLLPKNGLIQMMMAQALIDTGSAENSKRAIKLLRQAQQSEGQTSATYKFLARAYAQTGDIPRAELATAEAALLQGDRKLAVEKAKSAQNLFKKGTPEWTRANDVLTFASRD
ncbi:M48 family metalloprotease [Aestuariivirga sp.]|jgi:predicted Zn-dependent protease|uniref:M48 family metalloprotease n=1 Tax=Aestuariivirga sp. TaxID=2650926 RepID=UPI003784AE47